MHDSPYPELQYAFDYKPPPLLPDPSFRPLELIPPLSFYDKHLDERRVMKQATIWPNFVADLSIAVDRVLQSLKDNRIVLPPISIGDMIPTSDWRGEQHLGTARDGKSVAKAYQNTTSHFCGVIASTLLLSPEAPRWNSLLLWNLTLETMLDDYKSVEEDFVLGLEDGAEVDLDWGAMEEATRSSLRYISEKCPELAHWEVTAIFPESERLLRDMDDIAKDSQFLHDKCSTVGLPSQEGILPHSPDATTTAWGTLVSSFGETQSDTKPTSQPPSRPPTPPGPPQRRSARTNMKLSNEAIESKRKSGLRTPRAETLADDEIDSRWSNVTLPSQPREHGTKGSVVRSLLQRAWTRSVRMDSTFMVFHCGKYERIGFRHRASQTLFLSDLIDVSHGEDPAYGKLHTGLYISILHDILDRATQKMNQESENRPKEKKKRKREPEKPSGIDSKRPKTRGQALKAKAAHKERQELQNLIGTEAATRDIALVHMRFGCYNSPAPNVFVRSGQPRPIKDTTYTPDQYISLIVASKIAAGATGIVHNATLEFILEDRRTVRSLDVAVKFAFEPLQKEKMRHEYSIYQQLAASGVEGIPKTLGLFDDLENDTLALVMTHVGTALATIYSYARGFVVPQPQHAAFVKIMKGIHKAGVRHRDIRPENLMIDDNGEVYVIDFDMAQVNPTDGAKKREIAHLKDLLNGEYYPPNEFPSERTRDSESSYSSDTETET